MNIDKFIEDFNQLNSPVEIIGNVKDWNEKVECKCKLCGDTYFTTPSSLKSGHIHPRCSINVRATKRKKPYDVFIKEFKDIHNSIEIIGSYTGMGNKILVKCMVCNYEWNALPSNLVKGHGCPNCANNKKIKNKLKKFDGNEERTSDAYINKIKLKYKDIDILNTYTNSKSKLLCKCKLCGNEFEMRYGKIMNSTREILCKACNKIQLAERLKREKEKVNLSFQEFHNLLKEHNIISDSKPININDKVDCYCLNCQYQWKPTYKKIIKHLKCPRCTSSRYKTHDKFIEEINKINPNIIILSKYIDRKTKVSCSCKICGNQWESSPSVLYANGKCPACTTQKMRKLFSTSQDDFKRRISEKYNDEYIVLGEYVNINTSVELQHKKCGNSFMYKPNLLYEKRQHICPHCYTNKNSRGEYEIFDYLTKHDIEFEEQKTYDSLLGINNGKLRYDFYLPSYNTLIEFNGVQHYKPVKQLGGEERFKIQQEHDNRKRTFAKENNINLLEITYHDLNNVKEILDNYIYYEIIDRKY